MASGITGNSNGDLNSVGKSRWSENSKVYSRKFRKKVKNTATTTSASDKPSTANVPTTSNHGGVSPTNRSHVNQRVDVAQKFQKTLAAGRIDSSQEQSVSNSSLSEPGDDGSTQNEAQPGSNNKVHVFKIQYRHHGAKKLPQASGEEYLRNGEEVAAAQLPIRHGRQNDIELMPAPPEIPTGNGPENASGVVMSLVTSVVDDDRIRFSLSKETPKNEIKDLRKKLQCELDEVTILLTRLESTELQVSSHHTHQISNNDDGDVRTYVGDEAGNIGGYGDPQSLYAPTPINVVNDRTLMRINSGVVKHQQFRPTGLMRVNSDMGATRNLEPRPYNRQLSVSVVDHRLSSEFVEMPKRTPKANQLYRNSEFLLGKDRLPPESNKRFKPNNGRKHSRETRHPFGFGNDKNRNQLFKNCNSLLQRLMKHDHAWVFNEPVDVKRLGLVDYYHIITHPMDFGTIKTRLSQNWYRSPREFAEDVRLVFRNAMTYNPKGQDVHQMAVELSEIFEERWSIIDTEYNTNWKYQMYQDAGPPIAASRWGPPQSQFPVPISVPASYPSPAIPTLHLPAVPRPHVSRTPAPKKPKAKDPNKRNMTSEEKQKLSSQLQNLPPEKLDAIVEIIKRRSTVSQEGDEIEVDIDSVDAETLWELDRFVINYKKNLSKNKRKAELSLQARKVANQTVSATKTSQATADAQLKSGSAVGNSDAPHDGDTGNISSSSSSDSGSSSDSDSDSSSPETIISV